MTLKGKVAIVTGGANGIGKAIVLRLAREGAFVVIGDVDMASAAALESRVHDLGGEAAAMEANVADPGGAVSLVEGACSRGGRVDILVNNAGIYPVKPFLEITEEEWNRVIDVNLKGTFLCSQAAARCMVKQGGGKILHMSSIDGKAPSVGNVHYAASKAGVIGLTRSMAAELAPHRINVNAIAPGWIETETLLRGGRWEEGVKKVPAGRMGKPEEVAELVQFLVSPSADYITGEVIDINGGLLMD